MDRTQAISICILSFLCLVAIVQGYSNQAGTCINAANGHGSAQSGNGGYAITFNSVNFTTGAISFTLTGSTFRGILFMALNSNNDRVGVFTYDTTKYQALAGCGGPSGSTFCHTSSVTKAPPMTMTYAGPTGIAALSDITFRFSVLRSGNTWYQVDAKVPCNATVTAGCSSSTAPAAFSTQGGETDVKKAAAVLFGLTAVAAIIGIIVSLTCKNSAASGLSRCCLHRRPFNPPASNSCVYNKIVSESTLDAIPSIADLAWGEWLLVGLFLGGMLGAIGLQLQAVKDTTSDNLQVGRAFGAISAFSVFFAALPTSRRGIMKLFFGIPYERMIKYHRWAARWLSLMMLIHAIPYLANYPDVLSTSERNEVVPVFGLISMILFYFVGLTAINPIRRAFFELFKYAHFTVLLAAIFTILHKKSNAIYVVIPFALWFIDVILRFVTERKVEVTSLRLVAGEEIVELVVQMSPDVVKDMEPGSYFFLTVSEISFMQQHPFTVSKVEENGQVTFHMRSMGEGSWTGSLAAMAKSGIKPSHVKVQGPHGKLAVELSECSSIVLVSGGIGITPMGAILQHLTKIKTEQTVRLIWVMRNRMLMETHMSIIQAAAAALKDFKATIYISDTSPQHSGAIYVSSNARPENASGVVAGSDAKATEAAIKATTSTTPADLESASSHVTIVSGRPVWEKPDDVLQISSVELRSRLGVFACGPTGLMADAQRFAGSNDFLFHKEIFAF